MSVKLLTEHHLEFLSLKGGCTGSSESTLVKMPHCWKSHVAAQICQTDKTLAKATIELDNILERMVSNFGFVRTVIVLSVVVSRKLITL